MTPKYFKSSAGNLKLPVFFPDATRAVIKTLDSTDIGESKTPGILVNTFHLYMNPGRNILKKHKGVRNFMNFYGAVISDSGGFQVMSVIKKGGYKNAITDNGIKIQLPGKPKVIFTPEESIRFQMDLKSDMVVVLDDFTDNSSTYNEAKITVERTLLWAERCKIEFEKICRIKHIPVNKRPYILGVVQGGNYPELRKYCTKSLVKLGFDGLGYGGWPINEGRFNYEVPRIIRDNSPKNYLLYGLGVGKPEEIIGCYRLGFTIFDCVLPTRDARHKRLYIYNSDSMDKIDIRKPEFYSFYTPDKEKYLNDTKTVSSACDCILCKNYSRSYLAHLFKIKELTAMRLASIHNLRFYSILMEKLQPHTK